MRGVTIKAPDRVDPAALQAAANVVALMLDGRRDIADCIADLDSAFAIFPKDAPVTDLPEFSYLRGRRDMWGRPYEGGAIFGLGGVKGNPVSAASEQSLIPDPQYPNQGPWVAVHEFAHHLMNLCFTEEDHNAWAELRQETLEADLGYGAGLMVNVDEFFAGVSTAYFSIHYAIPRRHLAQFPPGVLERLEEFYGALTPVAADVPGRVRYVSSSGVATPWVTATGGAYEHAAFGYTITLPSGWSVEQEESYETLLSAPSMEVRIRYRRLPDGADRDEELARFAESDRDAWERWTAGWDESEVRSFERESADGQTSYWIRYYGHESPGYCSIDRIHRLLIASHDGSSYAVAVEGGVCGAGQVSKVREVETILRSFTPDPG